MKRSRCLSRTCRRISINCGTGCRRGRISRRRSSRWKFQRQRSVSESSVYRRSTLTAHSLNDQLGWAEIHHPFHPLRGQRFGVLKTRRVGGTDTLILKQHERGSFSVPREWTDWGTPSALVGLAISPCHFDIGMLLDLIALIEQLTNPSLKTISTKED